MTTRVLDARTLSLIVMTTLLALSAARIAQGAMYVALGMSPSHVILNATGFGLISAACCGLITAGPLARVARWAAIGGVSWAVAAALGIWFAANRRSGEFVLPAWGTEGGGGHVYYLDTAIVGGLSALGSSAALLGYHASSWARRITLWVSWAFLAALFAMLLSRG